MYSIEICFRFVGSQKSPPYVQERLQLNDYIDATQMIKLGNNNWI